MDCRKLKKSFCLLSPLLMGCTLHGSDISKTVKPNIVFFLIDDLGYKDLGCYGSSFYETPNIDKLAARGMLFTNAYSACAVCSPSRAALLTGKYPARLKITDWTGPDTLHVKGKMKTPEFQQFLPLEEVTLAETLKEHGYSTCFIGKWHLGKSDYYPDKQGFDINIAGNDAGGPPSYFSPYTNKSYERWGWDGSLPNIKPGPPGEYLTDRLTDEAVNYLDTIGNKPFFLYISHYAVHVPLRAKKELVNKYREKAEKLPKGKLPGFIDEINRSYTRTIQDHDVYAAMIQSMDESIGRIMQKIEETGASENTIIVFTSDNGGLANCNFQKNNYKFSAFDIPTSVLPLRAGKGWYYEGGIRVPAIIYKPGAVTNGSKSDVPIISTDFYPTLLEMCRIDSVPEQHQDGKSLAAVLEGQGEELYDRALYWHYPHYHSNGEKPTSAIRKGQYKLIQRYEDRTLELYDLGADVSEQENLAEKLPQVKQDLLDQLENWKKSVHADLPAFIE